MNELLAKLKGYNFNDLADKVLTERNIKELATILKSTPEFPFILESIISQIPNQNATFDWNCGNLLCHFESHVLVRLLKTLDRTRLYGSTGISWAIGELGSKDVFLIDFLYSVIKETSNSESWWNAAFSLEKLDIEQAIPYLKANYSIRDKSSLEEYLNHLSDKKSIVGVLLSADAGNTRSLIYPRIKQLLITSNDPKILEHCSWLAGRFKFFDNTIKANLFDLLQCDNYEIHYNALYAIVENSCEAIEPELLKMLSDDRRMFKKAAIKGLSNIGKSSYTTVFEERLEIEDDESVIKELAKAIYTLKNSQLKKTALQRKSYQWRENGMISDDSDKWYGDPSVYHVFSECEDPENVSFNLVMQKLKGEVLRNPIDIASGTGRMAWEILKGMNFTGNIYCLDASTQMCDYLEKRMSRDTRTLDKMQVIHSDIVSLPTHFKDIDTNFIISSFGFPSRFSNRALVIQELKAVAETLSDDGHFVTIGWDESFNDTLNELWFRYIPDSIDANNFEDWRKKRSSTIPTARNCNLTWLKRSITVPLQYRSLEESVYVMGHLFGRDAVDHIIKNHITSWSMSIGVTFNTKQELVEIIKSLESQQR